MGEGAARVRRAHRPRAAVPDPRGARRGPSLVEGLVVARVS